MWRVFCWFGFHSWRDVLREGVNFFCPLAPRHHVSECCNCGKVIRWGHTTYGSVAYEYPSKEAAIESCQIRGNSNV